MPDYRSWTTTRGRNMAGARALWRATGMKNDDFNKPIIAISNSFQECCRVVFTRAPVIAALFIFGTSAVLAVNDPADVDLVSPVLQAISVAARPLAAAAHLASAFFLLVLISRLAQSPHAICEWLATTQQGGLFRSQDCGKSFENIGRIGVGGLVVRSFHGGYSGVIR